jgi:hypothetical protein
MHPPSHKRNVEGLRQNALKRHQAVITRTDEALKQMVREGQRVDFSTVAKAAGVSVAWLYREKAFKQRIESLRAGFSTQSSSPLMVKATDASKEAILTTLRQRIKNLEIENQELKRQLEVAYGQLYKVAP